MKEELTTHGYEPALKHSSREATHLGLPVGFLAIDSHQDAVELLFLLALVVGFFLLFLLLVLISSSGAAALLLRGGGAG